MSKHTKTNVMRTLETAGISYDIMEYDTSKGFVSGVEAAHKTGKDETLVFKTLVTTGTSREHYVCVIPVAEELDLKKAAKVFGEKKIEMLHARDITKVTGYIKGGCSPVGMKKQFKTAVHNSACELDKIYVSAGKPGISVGVNPHELAHLIGAQFEDLIV